MKPQMNKSQMYKMLQIKNYKSEMFSEIESVNAQEIQGNK
jgi:hypothetical protein